MFISSYKVEHYCYDPVHMNLIEYNKIKNKQMNLIEYNKIKNKQGIKKLKKELKRNIPLAGRL